MNIDIRLPDRDDFFIIKNFIPLFRHYIGEVYNELPDKDGVFSYDSSKTLQEMNLIHIRTRCLMGMK